jgi:hypothetical protein
MALFEKICGAAVAGVPTVNENFREASQFLWPGTLRQPEASEPRDHRNPSGARLPKGPCPEAAAAPQAKYS